MKDFLYKSASVVAGTDLGKAAVKWWFYPEIQKQIKEGKEEVAKTIKKARAELTNENKKLVELAPELKKIASDTIDQVESLMDDLTCDKYINQVINLACDHFGQYKNLEAMGKAVEEITKDLQFDQKLEAFAKGLIDPKKGIIDAKKFEVLGDKLHDFANWNKEHIPMERKLAVVKSLQDGSLVKETLAARKEITDAKIEKVIDGAKGVFKQLFTKLKLTKEEIDGLYDSFDEIIDNNLEEFKALVDRTLKIFPKVCDSTLKLMLKDPAIAVALHGEHGKKAITPSKDTKLEDAKVGAKRLHEATKPTVKVKKEEEVNEFSSDEEVVVPKGKKVKVEPKVEAAVLKHEPKKGPKKR